MPKFRAPALLAQGLKVGRNFLTGGRLAELEAHNRALTEAATALEAHNRALTGAATERAERAQELERSLTETRIEIAAATSESTRLQAERNFFSSRMAELESHNRMLTEAATEATLTVQKLERDMTQLRIEIATLGPDNVRLQAEREFFAARMAEVDAHNDVLTKKITEYVHLLQGTAEFREEIDTLPSILFISMPKTGTVFTQQMLARGLGLHTLVLAVGSFPHYSLDLKRLQRFRLGGLISAEHFDASAEKLQFLAAFVDRWVIHIRDPRSVLLSWVHHLNRLYAERQSAPHELLYVCPTPPQEFFGYSFAEQVNWNIEHFLPNVLTWTRTWLETYDARQHNILLTTYADILANEEAFLAKILDFYAIPRDRFQRTSLAQTVRGSHFRVGRADEWRDCFTSHQIARTTDMIGDDLLRRFNWPVY